MQVIWGQREAEYFLAEDWTGGIGLIWLKKIVFWRNASRVEKRRPVSALLRPSGDLLSSAHERRSNRAPNALRQDLERPCRAQRGRRHGFAVRRPASAPRGRQSAGVWRLAPVRAWGALTRTHVDGGRSQC